MKMRTQNEVGSVLGARYVCCHARWFRITSPVVILLIIMWGILFYVSYVLDKNNYSNVQ